MAKCRLREKELRRRRHRYWKRKKQRIKQAILEARLRKMEQQRQSADLPLTTMPAVVEPAPTVAPASVESAEVNPSPAEPVASNEVSTQDIQPTPSEF